MSSRFQIFNIRDSKFWRTYWENIIKSCKKSSQKCVNFTIMLHRFGTNRLASMQISISDWSQNMFFWGNKSGDKLVTFCLFGSHKRSALKWADHISRQKVANFDWGESHKFNEFCEIWHRIENPVSCRFWHRIHSD